jgi:hypothetical protein
MGAAVEAMVLSVLVVFVFVVVMDRCDEWVNVDAVCIDNLCLVLRLDHRRPGCHSPADFVLQRDVETTRGKLPGRKDLAQTDLSASFQPTEEGRYFG